MPASPADRTRRFLQRVAPDAGDDAFTDKHIEIVAETWTPAHEAAAALAVTLLLRLDGLAPVIHLRTPHTRTRALPRLDDGTLIDALAAEHAGFASASRLTSHPADDPFARITFGGDGDTSVWVDGWRVALGEQVGTGDGNGLAAAYAGVLGANDIFQSLLAPFGVRVRPYRGMVSLWDLRLDGVDGPALPDVLDLNGVAFAACGGVASATGWALALHPLAGSPTLVDPDHIDDDGTNLNRHLTASMANLGDAKAVLLDALLCAAGADPKPMVARWSDEVGAPEIVIATPDDDAVRREAQAGLPRILLSGGTGDDGVYIVSRHNFVDDACVSCIARADLVDSGPVASAARRLGLLESDLAPYLLSDAPLPADLLARSTVSDDARSALADVPGRDLLEAVCATIRVAPAEPAVSAPTLAAAPGVLVAAELAKELMGAHVPLRQDGNVTMSSVLSGPHSRWVQRRPKRDGCECGDDLYIAHYRKKWSDR